MHTKICDKQQIDKKYAINKILKKFNKLRIDIKLCNMQDMGAYILYRYHHFADIFRFDAINIDIIEIIK